MTRLRVTIERSGVLAIPRNQLRDAFREGIRKVGEFWWKTFLPIHFTQRAIGRYHYTRRKAWYTQKKLDGKEIAGVKPIGDPSPLVFSGRSRERATSMKHIEAIAKSADVVRVDVIINAPALNFRYKGSTINMRDEVTATIPSEFTQMETVYARESERELVRRGNSHRITKKIAA